MLIHNDGDYFIPLGILFCHILDFLTLKILNLDKISISLHSKQKHLINYRK
jgi:hypothetical protein